VSTAYDDLIDKALGSDGLMAKESMASMKRRAWAMGYLEGRTGGVAGSIAAYQPALRQAVDLAPFVRRRVSELRTERDRLEHEIDGANKGRDRAQRHMDILQDVKKWIEAEKFTIAKSRETVFHKVIENGLAGNVLFIEDGKRSDEHTFDEVWPVIIDKAHVFLIEHDWAAAFKNSDIAGETKAPHEICCFEMIVNDHRVCSLSCSDDSRFGSVLFVQTPHGWAGLAGSALNKCPIAMFVAGQVRAICISLDAEVAQTEVVRAPYKLNAARAERGKLPLFDYRVVSLAKRSRASAFPSIAEPGHHKRLHWRRGHWRHFTAYKTWIKWMLVGDPDLGFVDKHYRL